VAGLCGSQGSGKTTMAAFLKVLLAERGLDAAVLSIDDLYLTLPERQALGRQIHPLLATRGPPGTHDIQLGHSLLDALTDGAPLAVSIPRFDKALDTRAPADRWPRVRAPVDVVLLEGWCVGAAPQEDDELIEPVNALERDEDAGGRWRKYVNDRLKTDYARFFGRIDILALLQAPGFEAVFAWRALQERKLAAQAAREGLSGARVMTPDQLSRFLMAYERLTRHILAEMPARAEIVLPLGADHRITEARLR
jgi:D-glycerate 3-kinase